MTLEELKNKIDTYFGMFSIIPNRDDNKADLDYVSPSGVLLFTVHLTNYTETTFGKRSSGWGFGGTSNSVPNSWSELCDM